MKSNLRKIKNSLDSAERAVLMCLVASVIGSAILGCVVLLLAWSLISDISKAPASGNSGTNRVFLLENQVKELEAKVARMKAADETIYIRVTTNSPMVDWRRIATNYQSITNNTRPDCPEWWTNWTTPWVVNQKWITNVHRTNP